MERRALGAWGCLGLVACLACGGEEDADAAAVPDVPQQQPEQREPTGPGEIEWRQCGTLECAEVLVPLDPDDPEGELIPIAINRRTADPARPSYGVLMFNPGGPGASGKSYVENVASRVAFPFDVVGFDPRGVGESRGLDCPVTENAGERFETEGVAGAIAAFRAEGESCKESAGALFDHLGTNAVVADIERIRIALDVEQVNFYGISYGTRLGAAYAQQYPDRVRTLVLDSPMPPTADFPQLVDAQFEALLAAHQALISGCEQGQLPCPVDAGVQFERALRAFDQVGSRTNFIVLWQRLMASPPGRETLFALLTDVAGLSDEQLVAVLTQSMMNRNPSMLAVPEVVNATNRTVNCSDSVVAPLSESEAEALIASYSQRSELFASQGLPAVVCTAWPAARDPLPDISFSLQNPPLIVAGVADTLTPMPLAEALHAAIPGSSLLVSEHYGHGALSFGGECFALAMIRYLINGTLPPSGTVCPAP
jgi:pimeloyl-ACP methyl ester carboxylesterase